MSLARKQRTRWILSAALLLFGLSANVFADQIATLATDTDLKRGPSPKSETIRRVSRGTTVSVSDRPDHGYFRIILKSGKAAYISAGALNLKGVRSAPQVQAQPRPRAAAARSSEWDRFEIKLLGDIDLFTLPDLNPVIGAGTFSGGLGIGGEFGYRLNRDLALMLRVEMISKQVGATDSTTHNTYLFTISAMPIMVGVEYALMTNPGFSLELSGFGGISSAKFSSVATNQTAPNETDVSGSAFTFLFKIEADLKVASWLSLVGEGGFRLLSTAQIAPSPTGAGDNNFFQGTGAPVPVALNLSGLMAGLGLKTTF